MYMYIYIYMYVYGSVVFFLRLMFSSLRGMLDCLPALLVSLPWPCSWLALSWASVFPLHTAQHRLAPVHDAAVHGHECSLYTFVQSIALLLYGQASGSASHGLFRWRVLCTQSEALLVMDVSMSIFSWALVLALHPFGILQPFWVQKHRRCSFHMHLPVKPVIPYLDEVASLQPQFFTTPHDWV